MNLLKIQEELRAKVKNIANDVFNVETDQIAAETPPKTEFGDLAFPIAFELAKLLKEQTGEKQNPRAIAEQFKAKLIELDFVQDIQIAGPGYLNIFYNRSDFLSEALETDLLPNQKLGSKDKICIEHTSVNPNKSAHIGHVRNSVLGDTFVRILRANGNTVEIQNYIDNTGVQVADVVVAFIHLLNMNLADIVELAERLEDEGFSFDYYCWDLYAKIGVEYQKNEELKEKRPEVLHLIEEGDNPTATIAEFVATRNVHCILKTMDRLSIRYDLLPRESEILHLNFWQTAFEMMKEREVIKYVEDGKMAGCWVMPFESHSGNDDNEQDKILVRSNGTVTYTGKDIAYQMWKLGLLKQDFYYNKFSKYDNGKQVWITTAEPNENEHPEFGNAEMVYNVIDTRQSYPQEVVKKGVATIFPEKGEEASVHLSYEMVALSPSAAEELGFELSDEDRKKSFIEMSGRKGLGVKADDLINRLEANALSGVNKRDEERVAKFPDEPPLTNKQQKEIAHQIAVGALRYFLSKFTKNTVIIFDFKEALAFEGETGTYCQNATVRINSIFKKLDENALENAQKLIKESKHKIADIFNEKDGNDFWSVIILAFRLEETIQQAIENSEPAYLAKYTFNLAKTSNLFYQKHRIKDEPDELKQAVMICTAEIARRSLTTALETMGIKVPERM